MNQQKILRKKYVDGLISDLKSGGSIHLFRNSEFQIDDRNTLIMPHLQKPIGLLNKMNASRDHDFTSAIAIYEAFSNLTPIEAADYRFWNYVALTDLYPYMRERWPAVYKRVDETNETAYIFDHYLMQDKTSELMRNHLPGLWWSVHLSIDHTNLVDKYQLTRVLFWNQTLRTRTMGNYLFARNKEVALGLLTYFFERGKENFGNFEKEHQELTEYLNQIGGSKQLTVYNRNEIKSILNNRFPISNI
jgi:hypothetical protein